MYSSAFVAANERKIYTLVRFEIGFCIQVYTVRYQFQLYGCEHPIAQVNSLMITMLICLHIECTEVPISNFMKKNRYLKK